MPKNKQSELKLKNRFEHLKDEDIHKYVNKGSNNHRIPIFGNNEESSAHKTVIGSRLSKQMQDPEEKLRESLQHKKVPKKKKEFPKIEVNYDDLEISKVDTNKNKIEQRHLMKENFIPKFPSIVIICGSVASGKTTFFHNLLKKPQFYGTSYEGIKEGEEPRPYFDYVFLFTGSDDDMYDDLISDGLIKEQHVKYNPKPEDIGLVLAAQRQTIQEKGLLKAPKVMIVLEDIADDLTLLRSPEFRTLFIKPRQHNIMTIIMAQYLRFIPAALRRQAHNLYLFGSDRKSVEIICDEYCPSDTKAKDFMKLIEVAQTPTEESPYPFFNINKRAKKSEKFRKNLDTVLSFADDNI